METKTLALIFCSVLLFVFVSAPVYAQDISSGIAQYYSINADTVPDGSIIAASDEGYTLATNEYDATAIGITADNPAIALKPVSNGGNQRAVINMGKAYVRVNASNGEVKIGDLVTSSKTPGVGMKATHRGFVIGSALENFSPNNPADEGKVLVALDLHFSMTSFGDRNGEGTGSLKETLGEIYNMSAIAAYEEPSKVFKYVVAGLVVLVAILFCFFTFARIAKNGIEAFGRNPLAARLIGVGMVFNVVIAVAIVASGLGVAYLILVM